MKQLIWTTTLYKKKKKDTKKSISILYWKKGQGNNISMANLEGLAVKTPASSVEGLGSVPRLGHTRDLKTTFKWLP